MAQVYNQMGVSFENGRIEPMSQQLTDKLVAHLHRRGWSNPEIENFLVTVGKFHGEIHPLPRSVSLEPSPQDASL